MFAYRRRYRPWRPLATGAVVALALLVATRLWKPTSDVIVDQLAEGQYKVASVIDGDTLRLADGARVRLIGIDAPETRHSPRSDGHDQPLAISAREFIERAIGDRTVRLTLDKERIDKYGRILAYVWYGDRDSGEELLLNEELLRAGLAQARLGYHYADTMKRRFRAAEQEARDANRGLFREVPPR